VNPVTALVRIFINTFGITQPTPENEARAGRAILGMLLLVLAVLAGIGWLLRAAFLR